MSSSCPRCGSVRRILDTPSCPDRFHGWTDAERRAFAAEARNFGSHDAARAWLAPLDEQMLAVTRAETWDGPPLRGRKFSTPGGAE